jgi:protoporphyrinogen oxidase
VRGVPDPGRVLVLGCGPTGCGVAWRLEEAGHADYLVLEAEDTPGGLARSVVDDAGFTWDLGGHVHFSHYRYYDRMLDAAVTDGWRQVQRSSWIWIDGRFVPYPLQYNIHRLDPEVCDRLLGGLRRAAAREPKDPAPGSFSDWIERTYGRPLADHFLLPYNAKVWGHPLEDMGWSWIGDRVAPPDLERVERNVREGTNDPGWGPNDRFRYPERGGTGAIWRQVSSRLRTGRLRLGHRVTSIDARRRTVQLDSGGEEAYDTLVSSIPLDVLARITRPLPPDALAAARELRYSSVHVLGVGLQGGRPAAMDTRSWVYFPEPDSPYYRVTVFSNYSPHLVPGGPGVWSLMAEVCESAHRPVDATRLPATTVESMRRDGLIGDDATVLSLWHRRLERGYPTPTRDRDRALAVLQPALEDVGIYARGRFGGWKYEVSNQDHSFMQGVELADRLLRGTPEVTYPQPSRANSGEFREGVGR